MTSRMFQGRHYPPISPGTLDRCLAAQESELDALKSTYGAEIITRDSYRTFNALGAKITIVTRPPRQILTVTYRTPRASLIEPRSFQVEHLPPIFLEVAFPKTYPEREKPAFLMSCHWLTPGDLTRLCARLDDLWEEFKNDPIVLVWVDFLQNDLLEYLGVQDEINLERLIIFQMRMNRARKKLAISKPEFPRRFRGKNIFDNRAYTIDLPPDRLHGFVKDFDTSHKRELFMKQTMVCEICFDEVSGRAMTLVSSNCGHAFCNDCTRKQCETTIIDGCQNGPIKCMHSGCSSELNMADVRRLVGEDLFCRYDHLLLQRYLSTNACIATCPRTACQKPVVIDELDSRLGSCAACQFNFCLACRCSWHGVNPCQLSSEGKDQLVRDYQHGSEALRALLEKRYSKRFLTGLVAESQSKDWLRDNSKQCPSCSTHIEKSEGCNKMQCWKCGTRFCYLCGQSLEGLANPYTHFSDSTSPCNRRLFEGSETADDWDLEHEGLDEDEDELDELAWVIENAEAVVEFGAFDDVDFERL